MYNPKSSGVSKMGSRQPAAISLSLRCAEAKKDEAEKKPDDDMVEDEAPQVHPVPCHACLPREWMRPLDVGVMLDNPLAVN